MKQPGPTLTAQELELMKLVWRLGKPTVREVYEALLGTRKIAYTTVMTMMNVLVAKGRLSKKRRGKAFVYSPTEPRESTVGAMVDDFVGRVFGGSARPLLLQLVQDEKLSLDDIDEIRRMIRKAESKE
jgi:predicted transcriptional regulator